LKAYEAEVTQLRGVTDEQQKALRAASRQLEDIKVNERMMQDEVQNLKTLLEKEKTHTQVMQNAAQRRYDLNEESMLSKMERQKNDLNAKVACTPIFLRIFYLSTSDVE
jgi:multidrug resistance efflux pump